MNNQYEDNNKMYKRKLRTTPPSPKPSTVIKLNLAKRMISDGKHIDQITKSIGYKCRHTTLALLRDYSIEVPRELCGFDEDPDDEWFKGEADASDLTKHELERCKFLGIKPERWAWLKTCPKGGTTKFDYSKYKG